MLLTEIFTMRILGHYNCYIRACTYQGNILLVFSCIKSVKSFSKKTNKVYIQYSPFLIILFLIYLNSGFIKDSARPSYWVPDHEITNCCMCNGQFGPLLALHHCRDCGQGVCSSCSANKKSVPKRNWEKPVRVCDECYKED